MKLPKINIFDIQECYIAGGAVLSTVTKQPVADWDIYPKNKEALVGICEDLHHEAELVNLSDRAVTYKHYKETNVDGTRVLIQVIRGEFPTPESIFENFDFTVCMGAFDCDSDKYTFHEDFWLDVASKTLRFNPSTKYPLNSLIRTYKYTKKGFSTSKTEMAKIALTVANKGMPNSWEELENEIGGTYGRSLKLARDGEEFSFDKAVEILSSISDESFEGYTEDFDDSFSLQDIKAILEGPSEKVVYQVNDPIINTYVTVDDEGFVTPVEVSNRLIDYGVSYVIKDLKEIPYVSAWKQLKVQDGKYIGGVWSGNHNGVTYEPFQKTRYETGENLFCYVSDHYVTKGAGIFKAVVKVPTKDIVSIDTAKIKTKSMVCLEVVPSA